MNIFKKIFKKHEKEQPVVDTTPVTISSIKVANGYQVMLPSTITLDKSALIDVDDLGRLVLMMARLLNYEIVAPDSAEK